MKKILFVDKVAAGERSRGNFTQGRRKNPPSRGGRGIFPSDRILVFRLRSPWPMRPEGSVCIQEAIGSMESGDTIRAIAAARKLARGVWERRSVSLVPDGVAGAFHSLLERRGYFVSTPPDLAATLEAIRKLGAGFDPYDLPQ